LPWLCQGDLFSHAPVVMTDLDESGELRSSIDFGPALLLTHDCAMDKPGRDGKPRIDRLQFAAVRSVESVEERLRSQLDPTSDKVGPFEALALGEVAGVGDAFILLSDPYYVPAEYFQLSMVDYSGHENAGDGSAHFASPSFRDTRIGRLTEERTNLLRRKMIAYWMRLAPAEGN
jgi:hypothetical protein